MKLATVPSTGLDGRLVVVSRDLRRAAAADDIAATLLDAVERWDDVVEQLADRADRLEAEIAPDAFDFDPGEALAPLRRAPQRLDGSVFQRHLDLMAMALHPDKANEPAEFPYMYQGASDDFRGSLDLIAGYRFDEGSISRVSSASSPARCRCARRPTTRSSGSGSSC